MKSGKRRYPRGVLSCTRVTDFTRARGRAAQGAPGRQVRGCALPADRAVRRVGAHAALRLQRVHRRQVELDPRAVRACEVEGAGRLRPVGVQHQRVRAFAAHGEALRERVTAQLRRRARSRGDDSTSTLLPNAITATRTWLAGTATGSPMCVAVSSDAVPSKAR